MLVYVIVAALAAFLMLKLFKRSDIDLPGPTPWPLFGNIFQLNTDRPHDTLDTWHKKYNGLFKIYQLGTPVVVVGSQEAVEGVLIKRGTDFAERPTFYRAQLVANFHPCRGGILFSGPTSSWKKLRQVAQKNLKQFDAGLKRIEEVAAEISQDMMESFASHRGELFQPREYILNAVMNNAMSFLLGKKFSREDKIFQQFIELERKAFELLSVSGPHAILDVFPWVKYFGNQAHKKIDILSTGRSALFDSMKQDLMARLDEDEQSPLVREFLDLAPELEGGELQAEIASIDMTFGGTSTSTTTLHSFVNIITHYTDVYRKLQTEVDQILGERQATLDDRQNMPYMSATLLELLRYTSIVPLSVPLMAAVDSRIGDVTIPKGTQLIINLWSYLHDESYWPEPYMFKPERFLDDGGNLVPSDHVARKRLLAFGAGPRVCVGEIFAKNRLFLLMCSLIQSFEVEQPEPKMSCDPRDNKLTLVLVEPDISVRMTPRRSE